MLLFFCHRYLSILLITLILEALSCLTAKRYRYFYQIVNMPKIWKVSTFLYISREKYNGFLRKNETL